MALGELLSFVWTHPLNAGHRWAALGRVARWQIASRLLDGPIALPFVDDTFLLATRGATGTTGNWYCGLHEVRDMAFVLHALRPGDRFLDVGANVGSYTILAAGAAGARVTADEPIPATFARLQRNVAFNRLDDRVQAHRCGLSEAPGTLRFTTGLDTMNRVVDRESGEAATDVPVRTLDEVAGADVPVLIKIDVEGHERSVLRGAARTLADPRLLAAVIEIGDGGGDDVNRTMAGQGFAAAGYDPFARRLVDAEPGGFNTIFVRDRAAIERRLTQAKRYRLNNGEI